MGQINGSIMNTEFKDKNKVPDAMNALKQAINSDPDYAWSWHCNIAVTQQDAGVSHEMSNDGAARFMKLCFDADVEKYKPKKGE
jgi:hypothetical protein